MPKPIRVTSALQIEQPWHFYRHIAADRYRPSDYVQSDDIRLVIHRSKCPRIGVDNTQACSCKPVQILHVAKRKGGKP